MSDTKLVSCPFCGGEATQYHSELLKGIYTGCVSVGNELCDFEPFCVSAQRKTGADAWNKANEAVERLNAINAELLEALQSTYTFLNSVEYSGEWLSNCIYQVKAAIAKAKGE